MHFAHCLQYSIISDTFLCNACVFHTRTTMFTLYRMHSLVTSSDKSVICRDTRVSVTVASWHTISRVLLNFWYWAALARDLRNRQIITLWIILSQYSQKSLPVYQTAIDNGITRNASRIEFLAFYRKRYEKNVSNTTLPIFIKEFKHLFYIKHWKHWKILPLIWQISVALWVHSSKNCIMVILWESNVAVYW